MINMAFNVLRVEENVMQIQRRSTMYRLKNLNKPLTFIQGIRKQHDGGSLFTNFKCTLVNLAIVRHHILNTTNIALQLVMFHNK